MLSTGAQLWEFAPVATLILRSSSTARISQRRASPRTAASLRHRLGSLSISPVAAFAVGPWRACERPSSKPRNRSPPDTFGGSHMAHVRSAPLRHCQHRTRSCAFSFVAAGSVPRLPWSDSGSGADSGPEPVYIWRPRRCAGTGRH